MAASLRSTDSPEATTGGAQLTAGTARTVITPPVGVHLTGFAGRPPSTGIHDDLFATALVLTERSAAASEQTEEAERDSRIALVTLDLLGMYGAPIAAAIKERVHVVTGIPPERVLLNCSHTHYGPVMAAGREGGDAPEAAAYHAALPHTIAGVVAMADAARQPVTLSAGRGSIKVGINRRERKPDGRIVLGQNPEGTLDSEVLVWRLDAAVGTDFVSGAPETWVRRSGTTVAVVVNYACHAVSLSGRMRLVTADFPGVARSVVEQLVGGTALYVQGACGDINPSLMGPDWEHPQRLGRALGAEAARVALTAVPIASTPLRVARQQVAFPALLPTSVEAGRALVARLEAEREQLAQQADNPGRRYWNETRLERARSGLAALEGGPALPPVTGEITALRIGDAALAANPAELFCGIGMAIKQESPVPWTGIAGYTDGAIGYVPTRTAYPEGGYEVESACQVNPEAGDLVHETSVRLLSSLVD